MCGRYTIIAKAEEIVKRFNVEVPDHYTPRYNAAPTQILPVITNQQPEGLSFFRWGLIPPWSRGISIGAKLINARSETVTEKPSFKNAFKSRRCLVMSDGYYEWKKASKKAKIPYRIQLDSGHLFSFAGLWESYEDEDESIIHSFTILTTRSNDLTAHVHERMPVILTPETEKIWLNNDISTSRHLEILQPFESKKMKYYTVSNLVNSVQNENKKLIDPAPAMDQSGNLSLFD
jgi:putative SOS response-associated peptidase YedK